MNRRGVIAGMGAALLALGAGVWRFGMKHYPATPYDDLLDQIEDREAAATLGASGGSSGETAPVLAARLRAAKPLAVQAAADAGAGRTVEISGWVLPKSVADYAALAALSRP